jgi:DNA repair exonuclease SbcCD ATPase subunit
VAAEYEVNIKLNTGKAETQLNNIESSVKKIGKTEKQAANESDRRVASLVKLRSIGNDVAALQKKGVDVSKAQFQIKKAGEAIEKKQFLTANERMRVAVKELKVQRGITRQLERQEKAQRRKRKQRLESIGLGVGFPLLFGGGAGSVIGGGLGGLTGSFGAQIALSAIGQQIDQFIASVAEAGRAFGSLEGVLDLMRERSLFTTKSSEELAEQLQELGDVEALAELATLELASKIGSEGIGAFQDLETELDEFDRLVGHLIISLQAFVAGPLGGFLDIVNAILGKKVTQGTIDRLAGSLQDPADQARFRAMAKRRIGTELEIQGFGMGGLPRSAEVLKSAPLDFLSELSREVAAGKFGESNLLSRPVKITRQDRESLSSKSGREADQLQKRLDKLKEERQTVIEISRFRDKIAAANAAGDEQLAIRLQGEQRIAKIEGKRRKDLAGVTDQREIEAINIAAATKKLAAQRDIERELAELQRQKQEKFETTIENLDHQLALARATTEEERERLRIEEAIKKLREDDGLSEPQLDEIRLRMEALAEERNLINTFLKETEAQIERLSDPMFQAIELSKTLGNAFSESFRGIVDGSMTAQQALANLFQRTAQHFLDMAAQMIAAQIRMQAVRLFMSFFGASTKKGLALTEIDKYMPQARANGGPVGAGRPYMVGERGPELFVPGAQGNIVPNSALGSASVTVNVDASGSSVEGDADQASMLGKALGIAVQQELVKQKRPGGLLAR